MRSSVSSSLTATGTDAQPLSLPQPADDGVKHNAGSSISVRRYIYQIAQSRSSSCLLINGKNNVDSSGTGISAAPAPTISPQSLPAPQQSASTPPYIRDAQTPLDPSIDRYVIFPTVPWSAIYIDVDNYSILKTDIDRTRATAQVQQGQPPAVTAGRASLWDNARAQLPEKIQEGLGSVDQCDINLVKSLIETIQEQKEACDEKRWSYVNTAGQKVFYLETLIEQLNKYALIGDIAIQHNPDIVALAWSGFRFLLQVSFTLDGHPILDMSYAPIQGI